MSHFRNRIASLNPQSGSLFTFHLITGELLWSSLAFHYLYRTTGPKLIICEGNRCMFCSVRWRGTSKKWLYMYGRASPYPGHQNVYSSLHFPQIFTSTLARGSPAKHGHYTATLKSAIFQRCFHIVAGSINDLWWPGGIIYCEPLTPSRCRTIRAPRPIENTPSSRSKGARQRQRR